MLLTLNFATYKDFTEIHWSGGNLSLVCEFDIIVLSKKYFMVLQIDSVFWYGLSDRHQASHFFQSHGKTVSHKIDIS